MTTVLIVDDEEGIRHGLSRFLEREGYAVELAEDSVHAESILKNKKIDCAILDLRLKEPITGLDLLAKIKEEDPEIPVIIITAYGIIESAIEAMKRGASDYILKPIDNESLLTLIKRNLEIAQLRRDNRYLKNELLKKEYQQNIITKSSVMLEILAKLNIIIHVGSGQYREDGRAPNLHEYTRFGAFLFPLVRKKANFVFNIRSYLFSLFLLACQLPQPDKL